jgi:hypothetical protein
MRLTEQLHCERQQRRTGLQRNRCCASEPSTARSLCHMHSPLQCNLMHVGDVWQPGGSSRRHGVRCMAGKAARSRREHCCSGCGYSSVQFFGVCPNCGEFGTCAAADQCNQHCMALACLVDPNTTCTSLLLACTAMHDMLTVHDLLIVTAVPYQLILPDCSCKEVAFAASSTAGSSARSGSGATVMSPKQRMADQGWLQASGTVSSLSSVRSSLSQQVQTLKLTGATQPCSIQCSTALCSCLPGPAGSPCITCPLLQQTPRCSLPMHL